jgi:hypothetical protein
MHCQGYLEQADAMQQRGLASAAGVDNRGHVPRFNVEVDIPQHDLIAGELFRESSLFSSRRADGMWRFANNYPNA